MKFLAFFLSLCITLNVFAATLSPVQELERQMDEFHYTLAVEWDQKDQKFYDAKTDEFIAKVAELIKTQGLTKEDILSLSERKVKDKKALEAIKLKMSLLSSEATAEELISSLKDSSKEFYSKGASWIGGIDPIIAGFIGVFVLAIGYSIWWSATHECAEWGEEYQCESYMSCAGYYSAGGECLAYTQEQDCDYVDVCKRWVKKTISYKIKKGPLGPFFLFNNFMMCFFTR